MHLALAFAWLAILAGGWLGWQLLRQNGRLLLRLDELEKRLNELEFGEEEQPKGLPVGREAPAFELPDLGGKSRSLAEFRGEPQVLIFFNPACGFCRDLLPRLAALSPSPPLGERRPFDTKPQILIMTTGSAEANRELFKEHLSFPVLLQKESEVADAYKTMGTPSGYLINGEGKIASRLAMGGEALLKLLDGDPEAATQEAEMDKDLLSPALSSNGGEGEEARGNRFSNRSLARSKIRRNGLEAGTPAPEFRLPRLDGRGELSLSELRGRQVLLVFSSPSCGPCNTLGPELEKFHREHPEVEVVMISKGEPKENRAKAKEHGLTFPIVLQRQWEISRLYAMFATPIAYLIDEGGVITTDAAVGIEPIRGLLARSGMRAEMAAMS